MNRKRKSGKREVERGRGRKPHKTETISEKKSKFMINYRLLQK